MTPRAAPALAAALVAALVAGCGSRVRAPLEPAAPPPPAPPAIADVHPAPRAVGSPYDAPIWVEFSEPVDASTLTDRNVFLKLDTRREPVTLAWDAARRRLTLEPGVRLRLRRTYTVEITPRVRTAAGAAVAPQGHFWQFTTNSLRRLRTPRPGDGATFESPVARLAWDATDAEAGPVEYRVWIGPDSAAVAGRQGLPIAAVRRADWLPRTPWPTGSRLYWSVHARHLETGETGEAPVWRFETLPADTPVDSLVLPVESRGYVLKSDGRTRCTQSVLGAGQGYNNAIRWRVPAAGPNLRLAGASVTFSYFATSAPAVVRPAIYATTGPWEGCAVTSETPKADPGLELASDGRSTNNGLVTFQSTVFAAHLEAVARDGDLHGYSILTSGPTISLGFSTSTTAPNPAAGGLVLLVYRTPTP